MKNALDSIKPTEEGIMLTKK